MTVLDLINKSAIMLNIKEVLDDKNLDTISIENEQDVLANNFALKRLYEFAKIVIYEIASHIASVKEIKCKSTDKEILITDIDDMAKIIGVKNHYGYVKYSLTEDAIKLDEDDVYTVIYTQRPIINSVLCEIALPNAEMGDDILIHGLNSYYCLAVGLFKEFNVYNESYADKLSKLKNLKVFAMPCRSWHD